MKRPQKKQKRKTWKEKWTEVVKEERSKSIQNKSSRFINLQELQGGKCYSVYDKWFANDDFDCFVCTQTSQHMLLLLQAAIRANLS